MDRREFIQTGVTLFGSLAAGKILAQPNDLVRAAIVIGVKETNGLPLLNSTVPAAEKFALFLEEENFEVRLHTDNNSPVNFGAIRRDVHELVDRNNLDQLLVYFSGHGFRMPYRGEMWLLTDALGDSNEAINLVECYELGRSCGIPNLIFVSDACRSRPDSIRASHITGSNLFPNLDIPQKTNIDTFFAAKPGKAAYEVLVDLSTANYKSIYTESFLNAFENPKSGMVMELDNGVHVVPNRRLEKFLIEETSRLALEHGVVKNVEPDADVPSKDEIYIGRARKIPPPLQIEDRYSDAPSGLPSWLSTATTLEAFQLELERMGLEIAPPTFWSGTSSESLAERLDELQLEARSDDLSLQADIDLYGASSGIAVYGTNVTDFGMNTNFSHEHVAKSSSESADVFGVFLNGASAASAIVQFEDGTGTVVAVLDGYVAHVFVDDYGVESVIYDQGSENSELQDLRTVVAIAAEEGLFRLGGQGEERRTYAENLADKVRVMKASDPTLGIYAAYAYSSAGLLDDVRSVDRIMKMDLSARIFDLALLSTSSAATNNDQNTMFDEVYAFCPLMRAGWELLRVKGVSLHPIAAESREYLRDSLWTSFEPAGTEILLAAITENRIK